MSTLCRTTLKAVKTEPWSRFHTRDRLRCVINMQTVWHNCVNVTSSSHCQTDYSQWASFPKSNDTFVLFSFGGGLKLAIITDVCVDVCRDSTSVSVQFSSFLLSCSLFEAKFCYKTFSKGQESQQMSYLPMQPFNDEMLGFSTFSFCLLILKFELLTCGARRMPFQPSTFSLSEDVFITQFVTLRN